MNNRSTLTLLAEEIALAFQPLVAALESPATLRDFLEELGWDFTAAPTALNALKLPAENIYNLVNQSLDLNPDEIIALMTGINQLLDAIANLKTATDLANDFKTEFPRQLIDYLWVEYLLDNRPSWGNLLMALGIIRLEERPAVGTRLPYQRRSNRGV
jgi:plasmid maintenance system antidote protein VapI